MKNGPKMRNQTVIVEIERWSSKTFEMPVGSKYALNVLKRLKTVKNSKKKG